MASARTARIGGDEGLGLLGRDGAGLAQRRDAGAPEGLADVDVAEARDDALVEQDRLHRRDAAGHAGGEGGGGEGVAERLRAEAGEERVGVEGGRRPRGR